MLKLTVNWSDFMGNDRYDVIIVGAGPAGSSAAQLCAENNLSVALIEKGEFPGSKNMFGGAIYSETTATIVPTFWEEAPLERPITEEKIWFMEPNSVVEVGFTGYDFAKSPYNSFTVIRSRFDRWFADKAVQKGAHLITSTLVENLVYEKLGLTGKKVSGVRLEDGSEIYSEVVILAEGGWANLAEKAGLRDNINSKMLTIYIKELLALPQGVIEARFNLEKNEGCSIGMVSYPTAGAIGKGGIWTNRDTISLAVGGFLDQFNQKGLNIYQLLYRLKGHPKVKRLIEGAETVQYMYHQIPRGSYDNIPRLYDDGILVTGDAANLISGRHGTEIAMLSGMYAAETVIHAKAKGDFSKKTLAAYGNKLENTFFVDNMKVRKKSKIFYQKHTDSDFLISQLANEVAKVFFTEGFRTEQENINNMLKEVENIQPLSKTLSDLYQAVWHWRVL